MEITIEVEIVQTSMEALMSCQNRAEVLGFCQNCSNYKKNYTCPEFSFELEDYLAPYNYVALVMTTIKKDSFVDDLENLKKHHYKSQVSKNYKRDYPDRSMSWEEEFSMYLFNCVKDDVAGSLISIENKVDTALSIPPGSCTRCSICKRVSGEPCIFAKSLRYSLEALGFKVSDIYETFFNKSLDWAGDGLPETFDTCSAIFSKNVLDLDILESELNNMSLII